MIVSRSFRRSSSNGSLPTKKLAVVALFAFVAPLAILQLVLLAKVNVSTMNINVTDYLRPDSMENEQISEPGGGNVVDRERLSPSKQRHTSLKRRQEDSREILALHSSISNDSYQPTKTIKSSRKLFAEIPSSQRKTFYISCGKVCHPMIRALRVLGWTRVNSIGEAQFIWDYDLDSSVPKKLQSWQRYNKVMDYESFYNFWEVCYSKIQNLPFVLTTFRLPDQYVKFKHRLTREKQEWIFEDYEKDYSSLKVVELNSESAAKYEKKTGTMQKSICNAMTWNGRKLNIKVFWFVRTYDNVLECIWSCRFDTNSPPFLPAALFQVASTDPLVVFYMDGWANIIGRTKKDAMEEFRTEASFQELELMLKQQYKGKSILDPMMHVKKQMKQAIGQLAEVFESKSETLKTKAEDLVEFYAADFVVDENLNIWLTNIEQEIELGEDYYFRLDLNHNVHFGIASILQEIWEKQETELPLLPVKNNGLWELVYANGWKYEDEEYKRLPTRKKNDESCTPKQQKAA